MITDEYTECLTRHHAITLSSWWRVSTVAAGAEAMEVATGGEAATVAAGAEAMEVATEGEAAAVAAGAEATEVATGGEATTVAAGASGDATYGIRYNSKNISVKMNKPKTYALGNGVFTKNGS